MTVSENQL